MKHRSSIFSFKTLQGSFRPGAAAWLALPRAAGRPARAAGGPMEPGGRRTGLRFAARGAKKGVRHAALARGSGTQAGRLGQWAGR